MNIIFDRITPINTDLREYQITAKEDIYNAWKTFRTVMFQMPTGTGKTRLFSSIIKDMHEYGVKRREPVKILILAHREELISQISESIGQKYGIAHGKIKSRHDEEHYFPTQIASVQTLYRRIERWIQKDFDIIIIDEAHHVLAKTYRDICNKFPNAKLLGVTATPYRLNAEPFPPMFDILVQSKSIYQFIKDRYLCEYEYYSIKPQSSTQQMINLIPVDFSGDYDENEMLKLLDNKRVRANILETYEKYAKGKKGIVYTINKVHNFHVYETFKENGYTTAFIDSDTPIERRKEIVQQFKSGSISILCNVNIFSEGFDCPDVEFIQLARPTLSLAMYLQQVGRGFRIHKDKEKVIFLDNVGLFNRFGLPSANRKWQYYFEGKHKGIEFDRSEEENISFIIKPVKEGIEEVELLYDSKQEQEEPNELFWENNKIQKTIIVQKNIDMETVNVNKRRIEELEQKINVFKEYGSEVPEKLQKELDQLKKDYEKFEVTEQFIPQLQNFLWEFKEKFILQNDFSFLINYGKNNEFEILFNDQIYEASKLEYMKLDELQSALIKVIPAEIEVKSGGSKPKMFNNWKERKAMATELIEAGEYTRKELMVLLLEKFPGQKRIHNNLLSECKNSDRWVKFGRLDKFVEVSKEGKYRFAEYAKKLNEERQQNQQEKEIARPIRKITDDEEEAKEIKPVKKVTKVTTVKKTATIWPDGFAMGDTVSFVDKKGEKKSGEITRYFWHKQSQKFWFVIDVNGQNNYKHAEDVAKSKDKKVNLLNVKTTREKISVTFPDKTKIEGNNVTTSYVECIRKIGVKNIKPLNIYRAGVPLISETTHSLYKQKNIDGYWVMSNLATKDKLSVLQQIDKLLNLNLKFNTY